MKFLLKLKRFIRSKIYQINQGFKKEDIWTLYFTIAEFVLPRLKEFKRYTYYPVSVMEELSREVKNLISFTTNVGYRF